MKSLEDKHKDIDNTIDDDDDYYDVNGGSDDFQYKNMSTDDNDDKQNYDNNRAVSSTGSNILNRKQSLKLTENSPLFENIKLLINTKQLDKMYGFNQDEDGSWRNGKDLFNEANTMQIGNMKLKMTPGLFVLVFHAKPLHYTKNDLKKYKEILIHIKAHRRRYEPNEQVKGTRAFKYTRIIKHFFKTTTNI